MSSLTHAPKGLEGVTATNSGICYIDGDQGVLAYRGIDIHELADKSNFEECCYLLWFGRLPNRAELQELKLNLARERKLDASIISLLRQAPKHALPMDVLRTIVSALSFYDPEEKVNDAEANLRKSIRLTSQIAYVVAAYDRIRKGKPVIEPDRSLSHAANFLYQLNGQIPSPTAERALDIALILHADHELNASTFAARVVAATLSDMHSAITAAIGALKGPLHGGANEAVFRILESVDASGADPVDFVKGMLAQKKKIPGFGHRVYRTEDPRATHLRTMSRDLGNSSGVPKWFEISRRIEEFVVAESQAQRQRRLLLGFDLPHLGYRHRSVHARVRGVAHLRLDSARDGAVERQPPDPSPCRISGTDLPQPVRADGAAIRRIFLPRRHREHGEGIFENPVPLW